MRVSCFGAQRFLRHKLVKFGAAVAAGLVCIVLSLSCGGSAGQAQAPQVTATAPTPAPPQPAPPAAPPPAAPAPPAQPAPPPAPAAPPVTPAPPLPAPPAPPPIPPPAPAPPVPAQPASSVELLYVVSQGGTKIDTYSVDANTGMVAQLGRSVSLSQSAGKLMASQNARFLYLTTWSGVLVLATDTSGAPQVPPVQTLDARDAFLPSGFLLHPSGRFGYEIVLVHAGPVGSLEHQATLYLFQVDASTGMISNNPQAQITYPVSTYSGEGLYGFTKNGTVLYASFHSNFDSSVDTSYTRNSINVTTGELTAGDVFWDWGQFGVSYNVGVVGDKFLVELDANQGAMPGRNFIGVFPNAGNWPQQLIYCNSFMLNFCGSSSYVQLDPSEQFLFLSDWTTSQIRIVSIDVANSRLSDTGSHIRATSGPVTFSVSGTLVYAASGDGSVLQIYRFDPSSGALAAGETINVGTPFTAYAAKRE